MYDTAGHIASATEYGCDVYANAQKKVLSITTSYKETISVY